jgi:hypothetical protein
MATLMIAARHLGASGIFLMALSACGTGPGEREFFQYYLSLTAFARDTAPGGTRTYECTASAFFDVPEAQLPEGTVRFPLTINRRLIDQQGSHLEMTSADTTIAEVVLQYAGLGEDSLSFTLGAGSYTLSVGLQAETYPGEHSGPWTCGPDVPLAQDSTLLAYGYDPNVQVPGTWRIGEIIMID